ncbi:WXG100 family type VII secretion target [Nocardia gipuzkoensis]
MGDTVRVEPDRLREAAGFAGMKADIIEERVDQLDKTIGRELLVDGWQGQAASAYDESWLEWLRGARQIVDALRDSATQLAAAADLYEAMDGDNADAMRRVGERG